MKCYAIIISCLDMAAVYLLLLRIVGSLARDRRLVALQWERASHEKVRKCFSCDCNGGGG